MRLPILFLLASSPALADPTSDRVVAFGLEPATVPAACRPVVVGNSLGAKISVANCLALLNLRTTYITDTASSYAALTDGARPSIELLDQVIASDDPELVIEALHAKADLLDGLVVRMRNTAPPILWNTVGMELEHAMERHDAIEVAVADWHVQAMLANREILDVALQHPEAATNPIAALEIRDAEAAEAAVATR